MQPYIHVGIMFAPSISFELHGEYTSTHSPNHFQGPVKLERNAHGETSLLYEGTKQKVQLPLLLEPADAAKSFFELKDVTIGINFHWERQENQRFTGALKIIEENGHLTAINILPLEDYLKSVISSEMSATSSEALLKAHAVISRSWLLAQVEKSRKLKQQDNKHDFPAQKGEHIRWYDREDHLHFDVCADDHCQRYQGITRESTPEVSRAIDATRGQVLTFNGQICDARYSKCCGGISERFENVWEPVAHPYLSPVTDNSRQPEGFDLPLNSEAKAEQWINNQPEAFCNTHDKQVLSQVLNDYDQETLDFFRWEQSLTQEEIQELLYKKLTLSVGKIVRLVPIERGESGRLIKLHIEGTEKSIVIGKELEIRKAFSPSHLYSAAFVVEHLDIHEGVPGRFLFRGAGWGHGVGLCQIGAAVMGTKGYTYEQILAHYFTNSHLETRY